MLYPDLYIPQQLRRSETDYANRVQPRQVFTSLKNDTHLFPSFNNNVAPFGRAETMDVQYKDVRPIALLGNRFTRNKSLHTDTPLRAPRMYRAPNPKVLSATAFTPIVTNLKQSDCYS